MGPLSVSACAARQALRLVRNHTRAEPLTSTRQYHTVPLGRQAPPEPDSPPELEAPPDSEAPPESEVPPEPGAPLELEASAPEAPLELETLARRVLPDPNTRIERSRAKRQR